MSGLLMLAIPAFASADVFYPVATYVPPGETGTIVFNLENSRDIIGLEGDITLPDGLQQAGKIKLAERGKGMSLNEGWNDNVCHVVVFDVNKQPFPGTSGAILEMPVTATEDFQGGRVRVSDINLPVSSTSGLTVAPVSAEIATTGPVNSLVTEDLDITAGVEKEVELILSNQSDILSFLLDVKLPQGVTIVPGSISFTDRVGDDWLLRSQAYDDGNTRIIAMGQNSVLESGSGSVITFTLTATDQAPASSFMKISGDYTYQEGETEEDGVLREADFSNIDVPMTVTVVKVGEIKCANGEQSIQLEAGDSHIYNITVTPDEAYNKDLEWTLTEGEGVVALADGSVTALSVGKAVITVTAKDGGGASLTLNVEVIPIDVTGIEVKCEGEAEIMVDQTLQLTAEITPANATDRNVTWSSSDPDVAVVNEDGLVLGKGVGSTVITARSDNGIYGELTVTVTPVPVDMLTLDVANLALQVDETYTMKATILPENATYQTLTWSSTDESVATVTQEGFIRALAVGETVITAFQEDNNVSASCVLKVVGKNVLSFGNEDGDISTLDIIAGQETPVTVNLDNSTAFLGFQLNLDLPAEVTLVPESVNMERGNSNLLRYRDYGDGRVTFIYLNPDGFEPAKDETEDEATGEDGENEPEEEETPFEHPDNINPGNGGLLTFKVIATDKAEAESMFKLFDAQFTNADLAEVNLSDVELPVTVTVLKVDKITLKESTENGEEVELNDTTKEMQGTESFTFTWEIEPELAYDKRIAVTSSNPELVTVATDNETTTCTVNALGIGTATITVAALDGGDAQACFTVEVVETAADGITVTPGEATLRATETLQLTAEVTPANATDKTVGWTSGDSSVATVSDDGIVTAVAVGTAIITATNSSGDTAEVTITVEPTPVASIVLSEKEVVIPKGKNFTLEATVYPETATDKTYRWSSSDEQIASVDESGNVQAIAQGEATITATALDGSEAAAECRVIVTGINKVSFAGSNADIPGCENSLEIIEVAPYYESTAYVTLENQDAYHGFQFDILVPEGVEIVDGSWKIAGHEGESGFVISGRNFEGGVTRIIGLTMNEDPIAEAPADGEETAPRNIVSFTVVKSAEPESEVKYELPDYTDLEITLTNVSFATGAGIEHELDDATGTVRLYETLPMWLRPVVEYTFGVEEQQHPWSNGLGPPLVGLNR